MTRADFDELEKKVMKELVTRRQLGGYNSEAGTILIILEIQLRIVQHIRDKLPRVKAKDVAYD
jgi:hypothetical protein